ncbi:A24 family peptidase [Auraticoccus monumenti]|uniref:Leader peptidase (Prepilin peptidase) / N-methyltransferase n=1 Tax=Auraticoccus monumenti TaxID=675864 RepID=A0A1G6YCD2_9ACTN|nr:prepilin peptidase [Auraticoccus monumenti]SDD87397.1 leader peptidase (prepilin peptidase) / N-methyltransferase [Auraticoccus monumenti]
MTVGALGVALTAVACGVAALLLQPWARSLAGTDSRWLRRRVTTPLAAVGGAGAAVLASSRPELVVFALLAVGAALLVVVDLAVLRLPDAVVAPMYLVLGVGLASSALLTGGWGDLARAALSAGLLVLVYLALALAAPSNLGLGDVKLSGVVGGFLGWLGWSELVLGGLAAFAVSAVVALVLLLLRRATRDSAFPFGPCMVLGAVAGAAWGPVVLPAFA